MKYTVITGASSGIGRAAAESFAKRGKNLILTARRENLLEALRETLRQKCHHKPYECVDYHQIQYYRWYVAKD